MNTNYHTQTVEETLVSLDVSSIEGLSTSEVIRRKTIYGPNAIPESKQKPWYLKILAHFNDFLIFILLAAATFSLVIGEIKDGIVILVIVFANACMGYFQERKADNAVAELKKISGSSAKVIRDGSLSIIAADDLVPGDIIILENGDKIPADGRLLEAVHLKVSETSLTGESNPSQKVSTFIVTEDLPVGDRLNIVYKDTLVVFGRGTAVVIAIGKNTEMGTIFSLLEKQEIKLSPLAQELKKVGRGLTIFAGVTAVIILSILVLAENSDLKVAILTAISMAIAVVPEGIPAVVTTVLAVSVARLARNQAIIRKMEAVETLGAATCILTDKTGTLTKNEMTVTDIYTPLRSIEVGDNNFLEDGKIIDLTQDVKTRWLLYCAILCNDARINHDKKVIGDPTEACLLSVAIKAGIDINAIRAEYQRIYEIPFSSETKRMTVVVKHTDGTVYIITKGSVESVNPLIVGDKIYSQHIAEKLSANGTRNLTYASKVVKEEQLILSEDLVINGQEYIGTIGCKDPLRAEVKDAVTLANRASIRTIMITGDHKLIAQNIGTELGILTNPRQIMDGIELTEASDKEFDEYFKNINAFSRVSPEQKLKIVQAAQRNGEVVIVTGDGVNDAPAIKTADIGVAMGITGTDVAKESADMVLRDDNYSTIVKAIEQGRGIFGNFIKFLKYQISCNLSGVLIVLPVSIVTGTTPLFPVHILLLNLVSETGPSIALGLEKPDRNIMSAKPRHKNERLLTRRRWAQIIFESVVLAISGVTVFFITFNINPASATTAVLVTAFLSRLWHAFTSRSESLSIFSGKLEQNMIFYYIIIGTLAILALSVYTSIGNEIVKTVPLSAELLMICITISIFPLVVMEMYKFIRK